MEDKFRIKETEDGRRVIGDGHQIDHLIPGQTYHSTWDSPEAFSRYIEGLDRNRSWKSSGWDRGDKDFYGTGTMDEALQLSRYGWKEGAAKIEALRAKIKAANPTRPKLIKYAIAGAVPNVPRAVAGNLFNMREPRQGKSLKKPVITLVANMSANCTITPDMISNRAAVIAALIDEIENAGYSCEVMATAMSRGGWSPFGGGDDKFKAATTVIVKPSHQPVDLMKLSFAVGHAAMFRRLIFADWCAEPSTKNGLGSGLGNAGGGFQEEEAALLEKGIYLLPSAETMSQYFKNDDTTMDKGLPYIIQYLKDKGCPAFKDTPDWKDNDLVDVVEPTAAEDDDDW